MKHQLLFLPILMVMGLLVGCSGPTPTPTAVPLPTQDQPAALTLNTSPTPTSIATHTATPIPSPTATATPTPTPTPTAVPLIPTGDPRADRLQDPTPHPRNLCGVIDVLDFPIDPPHATSVSWGGSDFGVFRQRFDKYHAGEDWAGPAGQPTLGAPVYSIGHGVVTYAQPLGWGRDQGVIIILHNAEDGTPLLSFYGHLEPDSVVLRPGDCIARGELVGQIGQPRSSPHLHFEIRTQAPYATLTGYWPDDPTAQGWLPPSQTIWNQRLTTTAGVNWTRPFVTNNFHLLGAQNSEQFLFLEGEQLLTLDKATGRTTAVSSDRLPIADNTSRAFIRHDNDQHTLFLSDGSRRLAAYALPDFAPLWETELPTAGRPSFWPLPQGNLLTAVADQLIALDQSGSILWVEPFEGQPFSHALSANDNTLFFTTGGTNQADGRLWRITGTERPELITAVGGKLALSGDTLWLYHAEGLSRLDLTQSTETPQLVLPLPTPFLPLSDFIALPNGGVLLAHGDIFDARLIAVDGASNRRWDRSIGHLANGALHLTRQGESIYLAAESISNRASQLDLYEVQITPVKLTKLLAGGTRTAVPSETWVTAVGNDLIMLNIGGGHLVGYTPTASAD